MNDKLKSTDSKLIDLYGDIDSAFTDAQNKLVYTKYMILKELYDQSIVTANNTVSSFIGTKIKKVQEDFYINPNSKRIIDKINNHFEKKRLIPFFITANYRYK